MTPCSVHPVDHNLQAVCKMAYLLLFSIPQILQKVNVLPDLLDKVTLLRYTGKKIGGMSLEYGNQHFFASTRGHIVALLRRSSCTVDELAQALDITDNAVRSHLATLERDGLVRQHGKRRGGAKPASVYALTSDAEQLFPKAYDQVLKHLLDVLSERGTLQEREEMLRTVGRRFSTKWPNPGGNLQLRLDRAVEALNQLGGLAELEQSDETYAIHGYSCPFATVAPSHPEICQLAETLLTELVGAPVQQRCGSHGSNHCFFIVQRASIEANR